ncbi:hypothetical protein [Nostoc sp. MS1]|uniref:hypothetical protein n=1 Tax=Nostoc sp. MS1 TaxID=2764711 RepID=UPI001CC362E8|nr:hypothetical protein [Nostoc sp. MS1]BCL35537.1 hypothetical protein NSMS1_19840 [Nostoc sp. MS1]
MYDLQPISRSDIQDFIKIMEKIRDSHNLEINNFYPYALVLILILALILRFIGLDRGMWIDESFSFRWDKDFNIIKLIISLRDYDKPPLYFILLYFWTKINASEEFCRLLSIIFDIGSLIVLMKWLKQYSSVASILGGVYFATLPIILRYSQEIRLYSLLVFATVIAFFFASRIASKPEKSFAYVGLTLGLSLATSVQLVGIMLVPPIALFIILMTILEKKDVYWNKLILSLAIPCLIFSFFYFIYLTTLTQRTIDWWMPPLSWELLSSTTKYLFGLSNLFFHSNTDNIIVFIFFALLTMALFFGQWKNNYPFILAALVFWLEIIIYSLIKTHIFFYRIILPGIVPFIGFLVLQITSIKIKYIKKISIILLTILTGIFTFNWVSFQAYQPVEYYKPVANLIESQWQANNPVIIYPGYIASTVKYYLEQIPEDNHLVVWFTNDSEKLKSDIRNKLFSLDKEQSKEIFVVSRIDLTLKQEDYKNLLLAIKSEIKSQVTIKIALIMSHELFFVNNWEKSKTFLDILSSEFGQPLSYQDKKAYILSEYKFIPSQI